MGDRPKQIGGLWLNKSAAGKNYLTGSFKIDDVDHKIIVFKNDYKEGRQPDYKIFLKQNYEQQAGGEEPKKPKKYTKRDRDPGDDDDVTVVYKTNEQGEQVIDEVPF